MRDKSWLYPGFIFEKQNNKNQSNFDEFSPVLCVAPVTPSAVKGAGDFVTVPGPHSPRCHAESIVHAGWMVVEMCPGDCTLALKVYSGIWNEIRDYLLQVVKFDLLAN